MAWSTNTPQRLHATLEALVAELVKHADLQAEAAASALTGIAAAGAHAASLRATVTNQEELERRAAAARQEILDG